MEIAAALAAGQLISTVLGQLTRRNQPAEPVAEKPPDTLAGQPEATAGCSTLVREILSRYDVTDISSRDFSEMLQELYHAGALTDEQFQDLSRVRLDLDSSNIDPRQPLDLVQFYSQKLEQLPSTLREFGEQAGFSPVDRAAMAVVQRRLAWLGKVAAIQSVPDGTDVDQLA